MGIELAMTNWLHSIYSLDLIEHIADALDKCTSFEKFIYRNISFHVERSPKDKGDDTLQHYHYQHSYTCLLAIKLYTEDSEFDEILCEQHEDILGVTREGRFVGIQIKSRLEAIPFTLADEEIKNSISRFIHLEKHYPMMFSKFVIVSNCDYLDDPTGKSIHNLLRQVKGSNGTNIEFSPKIFCV